MDQSTQPLPKPYRPSLDEMVDNAVANMALEGHVLTPEEIAKVREKVRQELGMDQSDKFEPLGDHLAEFDRKNAELADWRRIEPRAVPGLTSLSDYRQRVAVGLTLARNYLADNGAVNPKPDMIEEIHRRSFASTTTDAGAFRRPGQLVTYGGRQGAEPQRVPIELARLHAEMFELLGQAKTQEDYCAAIAFYHGRYVAIQPFMDGNKRTGRLIMEAQANALGMKFGLKGMSRDQPGYFAALGTAYETNDIGPLTCMVAKCAGVELQHKGELIAASSIKSRPMVSLEDIKPLEEEREMAKTGMPLPLVSLRAAQQEMGPSL